MKEAPQARVLPDGRRLHLRQGPIDLIIAAEGDQTAVLKAYRQACQRFNGLLDELVSELPDLRRRCRLSGLGLHGPVAQRMERAVRPHGERFITPMAAVAGAVADEVLAALCAGVSLRQAQVNNGGDISYWQSPGETLVVGLVAGLDGDNLAGKVRLEGSGGIATSGWRGRSHSRGIADAVTVFAENAAIADAAATLIGNAVDLPNSPKVNRQPANSLTPDSDLGATPVTVAVATLDETEIRTALTRGELLANDMASRGLITGAALMLAGRFRRTCEITPLPEITPAGNMTNRALKDELYV